MSAPNTITQPVRYTSPIIGSMSDRRLAALADRPLPRIGTTARILMLCAREQLDKDQQALLRSLCAEVSDWDRLIQEANFRLIVPLVYRHLAGLAPGLVPEPVLQQLKDNSRLIVMRNLAMVALHRRLVLEVLEPLQVPFLFFKGLSLAYRYYREPALRQYRDIDVLVPRSAILRVGQRMREAGFTPYPDALWGTHDGLMFRQRFIGMMDWVSADGVLIEMPSSLDSEWNRLPVEELIGRATSVRISDLDLPVVPTEDFFCYLCKHHSRHHWARLHWIADLNVITEHADFDLQAIRSRAKARGFSRTVDAALAIREAAQEPEPWRASFTDPFARELFRHCLMNLEGDFEQELDLRDRFPATDIDIAASRRCRHHVLGRNLRRFRPGGDDFEQCPMPARWHWLYYLLRPFLWAIRKIRGGSAG